MVSSISLKDLVLDSPHVVLWQQTPESLAYLIVNTIKDAFINLD